MICCSKYGTTDLNVLVMNKWSILKLIYPIYSNLWSIGLDFWLITLKHRRGWCIYIWTFPKMGAPLNDPLYFWIVHYKPFILGYLHIWICVSYKNPYSKMGRLLNIPYSIYFRMIESGLKVGTAIWWLRHSSEMIIEK